MVLELLVTRTKVGSIKADVETAWAAQTPNVPSISNTVSVSIARDAIESEKVIVITATDPAVA